MTIAQRKSFPQIGELEFSSSLKTNTKPILAITKGDSRPASSPARDLQASLEYAFANEPVVEKWPAAYRAAVLGLGAVSSWAVIGLGASLLLKR